MNFRDPKDLLDLGVAFSVSITAGAFYALDRNTTVGLWTHWSLIVLATLALSLLSLHTYRLLVGRKRFVLQGENIANYEDCGFLKKEDPEDETGELIYNHEPDWKLAGLLGRLGLGGKYLANIRFKCNADVSEGEFTFTLYNGGRKLATIPIKLEQLPVKRFVYIDVLFEYDGHSDISFRFEPNEPAKVHDIVGFDRLEAYRLPKARVLKR